MNPKRMVEILLINISYKHKIFYLEQKMLLARLKHKEMIPIIEERIKHCEELIRNGTYQQF